MMIRTTRKVLALKFISYLFKVVLKIGDISSVSVPP